jgi:hypothetical protein
VGFGLIIRDWEGSILALMEDCLDQGPCPLFNQALGYLKALNFCRDTGFWLIDLDCEDNSLVSLIREGPTVLLELGHVIDEIIVVRAFSSECVFGRKQHKMGRRQQKQ